MLFRKENEKSAELKFLKTEIIRFDNLTHCLHLRKSEKEIEEKESIKINKSKIVERQRKRLRE